jgi:hypothetical protein
MWYREGKGFAQGQNIALCGLFQILFEVVVQLLLSV